MSVQWGENYIQLGEQTVVVSFQPRWCYLSKNVGVVSACLFHLHNLCNCELEDAISAVWLEDVLMQEWRCISRWHAVRMRCFRTQLEHVFERKHHDCVSRLVRHKYERVRTEVEPARHALPVSMNGREEEIGWWNEMET